MKNKEVIWTKCIFEGPPPKNYLSWSEWVEESDSFKLYTGVKISAIRKE